MIPNDLKGSYCTVICVLSSEKFASLPLKLMFRACKEEGHGGGDK